jgi:transcriptional regulator with XRE-family HTH domain
MAGQNKAKNMAYARKTRFATLEAMHGRQKAALRQAIRQRREAIGLSQEDLARRLDVSLRTLSRWERNQDKRDNVSPNLERIAEALDTTADQLTADALVIAGGPEDRPLESDEVVALIEKVAAQSAELDAQIARSRSQIEEVEAMLRRLGLPPADHND